MAQLPPTFSPGNCMTEDDPGGGSCVVEMRDVEMRDVEDRHIVAQRLSPLVPKPSCPMWKSSVDYLWRWIDEDVDRMERGLTMEKVDDDFCGKHIGGFNRLYGWLSPSKCDCVIEQAPQNTFGSRSSRDHDTQNTRFLDGRKHSEVPTTFSDVSLSHKTAHLESGSKNQRYAEVFFGSRHGSSSLSGMKHVEVSPSMFEAGFLDGFGAVIQEKAVMIPHAAPRYIGLYPHSADPPLSYTEKIPEPHLHLHNSNNTPLYHRPGRLNTICYQKNHCYYHHHRSLPGVQFVSKLLGGFFKAILQVVEAVTPAFVLTGLARIILLVRFLTHTLFTRFRRSDRFYNQTTQVLSKRHSVEPSKMDNWEDALFAPFIHLDMFESDLTPEQEQNAPLIVTSEELEPGFIVPGINMNISLDGQYNYMPLSSLPLPSPLPLPPAPLSLTPEMDWPTNFTPEELSRFDFSTFAPESTNMEVDFPDPSDTNPGLSPMSQTLSPLTEGLETPTSSPSRSSPVSIASPASTRKLNCGFTSCGHKQFDRPCDLNKHLKTHDKHLVCEFAKDGCEWVFCTKKDLDRHINSVHKKKKPFACHVCKSQGDDKRFTRKDNWRVHLRKVHGAEV